MISYCLFAIRQHDTSKYSTCTGLRKDRIIYIFYFLEMMSTQLPCNAQFVGGVMINSLVACTDCLDRSLHAREKKTYVQKVSPVTCVYRRTLFSYVGGFQQKQDQRQGLMAAKTCQTYPAPTHGEHEGFIMSL